MTEPDERAPPSLPALQSLRDDGAERFDPMRLHYLEVLWQRTQAASGRLRPILEDRLNLALADFDARFRQAQQAAGEVVEKLAAERPAQGRELRRLLKAGDYRGVRRLGVQPHKRSERPGTPLTALNQYIATATDDGIVSSEGGTGTRRELKSVRRFREMWSRMAAVDQVDRAVGRGPENAGPLNSHMLVLRSLALMRGLSPDYLRRFMSHVNSLLWLEQQTQISAPVEVKPARRTRQKK